MPSKRLLYPALAGAVVLVLATVSPAAPRDCVAAGAWAAPAERSATRLDAPALLARTAQRQAVLLGETHDDMDHHRWQLQTVAALHARRPDMVLGLEMFPRRVQPALDRWVAGQLSEEEFLRAAEWDRVWSFDPQLYLPLFHFARLNRVPMLALNVESSLVRAVSSSGFDAVPESQREGVSRPAPASRDYLDFLLPVWGEHGRSPEGRPSADDPAFRRFVESQQVWDRAMAQRIAGRALAADRPLVVAIMGSGHLANGWGVPHQLRDLGVSDFAVLLPWDTGRACSELRPQLADAVFGVDSRRGEQPQRPRLGVLLDTEQEGVRIRGVEKDSIAEAAGVREGDLVVAVAGTPARQAGQVSAAVQRQAPGTWLPLQVRRNGTTLDLVAKFPSRQ